MSPLMSVPGLRAYDIQEYGRFGKGLCPTFSSLGDGRTMGYPMWGIFPFSPVRVPLSRVVEK